MEAIFPLGLFDTTQVVKSKCCLLLPGRRWKFSYLLSLTNITLIGEIEHHLLPPSRNLKFTSPLSPNDTMGGEQFLHWCLAWLGWELSKMLSVLLCHTFLGDLDRVIFLWDYLYLCLLIFLCCRFLQHIVQDIWEENKNQWNALLCHSSSLKVPRMFAFFSLFRVFLCFLY